MAKFKKILANGRVVEFDIASYEELTGSIDFASRRRTITNKQRIPFQLQRGDQSQGFDIRDVSASSPGAPVIIKLDEELNYVAMPKSNYQIKLERELQAQISGASERRGQEIPVSVFNSIKSQISTRITQLPSTIMILAEDTGFSGSYNITSGSDICYSGIANQYGFLDRTFNNDSPTATGASWSFANSESTFVNGVYGNEIHQTQYTASFVVRTWASASRSGSSVAFGGFPHWAFADRSQSRVDSGKFYNYEYYLPSASGTGSYKNTSTAGYYSTVLKANIFGDGNETQFEANFAEPTSALYAQDRELLTFPYDTVVSSGSFLWCNSFETMVNVFGVNTPSVLASYSPIKKVELYWASGSGGLIASGSPGAGLSGSIAPLHVLPYSTEAPFAGMQSGSHIFYDDQLSRPASGGFYTTSGKTDPDAVFNIPNNPNAFNSGSFTSIEDRRFASPLMAGHVIHIAGEGIFEKSDPGENFAQNPFVDAHTSTGSKVIPAATRWNGQSFGLSVDTGEIDPGSYDDSGDN